MELLLLIASLALLGTLANRIGADSRDHFRSPEHDLAARGFVR